MDNFDYLIKKAVDEEIEFPSRYDNTMNSTIKKLEKKKYGYISNIIRTIITILMTLLGITGVCFATNEIYQYIQQGKAMTDGLTYRENGTIESLIDSDMQYDQDSRFYYKIITDDENYQKYKNTIPELPEMSLEDLNENALIILGSVLPRDSFEGNLKISNVYSVDKITYIQLTKDDSANKNNSNLIYAIVHKDEISDNVKIIIDYITINNPDFENVQNLSSDYSVDEAIKDGCVVVEKGILKSANESKLLELENIKSEEQKFVRIYNKVSEDIVNIIDIMYFDGLFYKNSTNIKDQKRQTNHSSFESVRRGIGESEDGIKNIIYSGIFQTCDDGLNGGISIIIFKGE